MVSHVKVAKTDERPHFENPPDPYRGHTLHTCSRTEPTFITSQGVAPFELSAELEFPGALQGVAPCELPTERGFEPLTTLTLTLTLTQL